MPFIVTAHHASDGLVDAYEDFVARRKLGFIRAIPCVKNYDVYRRGELFGPFGQAAPSPRFDVLAVLEVDDLAAFAEISSSPEFQEFRHEYAPWIEHHPGLYAAERVEQNGSLSREEYWTSDWRQLVRR